MLHLTIAIALHAEREREIANDLRLGELLRAPEPAIEPAIEPVEVRARRTSAFRSTPAQARAGGR